MPLHVYHNKRPVQQGDQVTMNGDPGHVVLLLFPGTQDAKDYACPAEGGVLFNIPESFGYVLIPGFGMDEDIEFVSRSPSA